jgi:hypothetical protein
MNEYYETHAYHTVSYEFSTVLADDDETDPYADHWYIYWMNYYDHKGEAKWEYTIWVKNCVVSGNPVVGWHLSFLYADIGIAISNKYSYYVRAIWHEYGHHIWINIPEYTYCPNDGCVMGQSSGAYFYCFHHWQQRQTM